MHTLYVHFEGQEAFMAEVDELPDPTHSVLVCQNPRKRDGKDLPYLLAEVNMIAIPWNRIVFVEVMPSGEEEEVFTFIRD